VVIPGAGRVGRTSALLVLAAVVLVVADLIAYWLLIKGQGDAPPDSVAVVPFVSGYMLVMAVLLALSLGGHPRLVLLRPAMLAFAAAGLIVLGIFAAFSIGVPIFVAGILAAAAAVRALVGTKRNTMLSEVAAGVIAVVVLVGGFAVTQRIIVCPPSGTMGGGGSGFLTGAYHYQCVDGTLTMYSGDCNGVNSGGVDSNGNLTATGGC
jgi:hypothetical protein